MIERRPVFDIFCQILLILSVLIILFPFYMAYVAASLDDKQITHLPLQLAPSSHFWQNVTYVLTHEVGGLGQPYWRLMWNSLIMALAITFGKILVSILSAYAIVFFRFPGRMFIFFIILITLMLPVEVRIFPTVSIVSTLHLMNSYTGLTLPLMASASATFLFRQCFMTIPKELVEAAKIDGAGPMRFFWDIVLPLSKTNLAALFVITFIYGWNQYLWPLLVVNNDSMSTAIAGIKYMMSPLDSPIPWNKVMAAVLVTVTPPLVIVLFMQKWFVRGLIEGEK